MAYSLTVADIVSSVNSALDSQGRDTIIALAGRIDQANDAPRGCPLS